MQLNKCKKKKKAWVRVEFSVGKTTGKPAGDAKKADDGTLKRVLRLCRNTAKAVPDEPNLAVEEGRGVQGTRRVAAFKGWILAFFTHLSSHSP